MRALRVWHEDLDLLHENVLFCVFTPMTIKTTKRWKKHTSHGGDDHLVTGDSPRFQRSGFRPVQSTTRGPGAPGAEDIEEVGRCSMKICFQTKHSRELARRATGTKFLEGSNTRAGGAASRRVATAAGRADPTPSARSQAARSAGHLMGAVHWHRVGVLFILFIINLYIYFGITVAYML